MEFLGGPGHSLERVHAKGHVHAWAVGQEGSKGRLLKQAEDQDLIPGGTSETRPGVEQAYTRLPNPIHRLPDRSGKTDRARLHPQPTMMHTGESRGKR